MIASGNGNRPSAASDDPGRSPYDREMAVRRRSRLREGIVAIGVLVLAVVLGIALRDHDKAPQTGAPAGVTQAR